MRKHSEEVSISNNSSSKPRLNFGFRSPMKNDAHRKVIILALLACCVIIASSLLEVTSAYGGTRRNSYGGTGLGTYGRGGGYGGSNNYGGYGGGYGNRNQGVYDIYPNNNHGYGRGMSPCGFGGGGSGSFYNQQNPCGGCQGSSYGNQCRPSGYGSSYGGYGGYGGNYGSYGGSSGGYGGYGGNPGGMGGYGGGYGRGYGSHGRGTYGSGGYGWGGQGGPGFMEGGMFGEDLLGTGIWSDSHDVAASTSSGQTQSGPGGSTSLTHEGGSFERSGEGQNQLAQWSERFAEEPPFRTFQQPREQQQHNNPQQPSSMVTYAGDNTSQAHQRADTDGHFIVHNGHDLATGDANNNHNNNGQTHNVAQANRAHASMTASSTLLDSARQRILGLIPSIPSSTTTPPPEYIMINQGSKRAANEEH